MINHESPLGWDGAQETALRTFALLGLLLVTGSAGLLGQTVGQTPPGARLSPSAARVGDLGRRSSIELEGNVTFSSDQILDAIQRDLDWYVAGHPSAPLNEYPDWLGNRIRGGYLRNGFAQVEVQATVDPNSRKVRVTIQEGPRYVCGPVLLSGVESMTTARIRNQIEAGLERGDVVAADEWAAEGKKPIQYPSLWMKGQPASFDTWTLDSIRDGITAALRDLGYWRVDYDVQVMHDEERLEAVLQIEMRDEGKRGVLRDIQIRGNRKNSREAILDFLELRPGMEMQPRMAQTINQQLYQSARFGGHKVELVPVVGGDRYDLRLDLMEHPAAPALSEPLTPVQQAWLRHFRWLEDWGSRNEDLVIMLDIASAGGCTVIELVISPQGVALTWKAGAIRESAALRYAALRSPDTLGLYSVVEGRKLAGRTGLNAMAFIHVLADPRNENGGGNVRFGVGANNELRPDDGPPLEFDIRLDPVMTWTYRTPASGVEMDERLEDGVVRLSHRLKSEASLRVHEFEAETGRLLRWVTVASHGKGITARMEIHPEAGAHARVAGEILQATDAYSNAYDRDRPVGSVAGYLVEELLDSTQWVQQWLRDLDPDSPASSKALGMIEQIGELHVRLEGYLVEDLFDSTERVHPWLEGSDGDSPASSKAVRLLQRIADLQVRLEAARPVLEGDALEKVWRPLDRLFASVWGGGEPDSAEESFRLPLRPGLLRGQTEGMAALVAGRILAQADDLWEPGTWPWTLTREACLVIAGKGTYSGAELERLYASDEAGPLAALVAARLLGIANPPVARRFSRRGLEGLSLPALQRDWKTLFGGRSALSKAMVAGLNVTMLSGEVLLAPSGQSATGMSEFLAEGRQVAQSAEGETTGERYWPLIERYWEPTLKSWLQARFETLLGGGRAANDPQALFDRAKLLMKSRGRTMDGMREALACMAKAAELGHGMARRLYAQDLLQGQRVPADPSKAEELLQLAVAQGEPHARCDLGWLYLSGPADMRNPEKAMEIGLPEAQAGCPDAEFMCGTVFEHRGDMKEALGWYRRSAEHGNADGQYALGSLLSDGISTTPDFYEAYVWLRRAQAQGRPMADLSLNIVKRRLTPEQIEQAGREAATERSKGAP